MDFKDLKAFVQNNPIEVMTLIEEERAKIRNAFQIKFIHLNIFTPFWKERTNKNIVFSIYFEESCIENLDFDKIKTNLPTITEALKTHNCLCVDSNLSIVESVSETLSPEKLIEISNNKKVVFFFGPEGIELAIRGAIIDRVNYFYNESDILTFAKKFTISDLEKCMLEYQKYIHEPGVNEVFFANQGLVDSLKPPKPLNNTLKNKPEKLLRDNLISFLNRSTQHTFTKENELNSQRELDLYTEAAGKKYLIEVKWLGQSINDTNNGFNAKVTDYSARNGVTQTLEYIQELIEKMNFNLHCGYLCVFDAREVKKAVNYDGYKFITADLKPYYNDHFKKLNEISLDRNVTK